MLTRQFDTRYCDGGSTTAEDQKRKAGESVLLLAVLAVVAVQFFVSFIRVTVALGLTMALAVLAIAALGLAINGRLLGAVIDNRNRVSLSKLQMLMWTTVVLSAMAVATSKLISIGWPNPLQQFVPWELLAAMGISAATLVASPAVLSLKLDRDPSITAVAQTQSRDQTLMPAGSVAVRAQSSEARFSDIFKGDDIANAAAPDLSKIQNFGITLLLVGTYVAALFARFGDPDTFSIGHIAAVSAALAAGGAAALEAGEPRVLFFPNLSHEFLWLMGISHGAYLAYKAAPHGKSEGASAPAATAIPVAHIDALG